MYDPQASHGGGGGGGAHSTRLTQLNFYQETSAQHLIGRSACDCNIDLSPSDSWGLPGQLRRMREMLTQILLLERDFWAC